MAESPERRIGDKAYDSDPLDQRLAERGIEMMAPHRGNRRKARTQDGRTLRRYRKRWRVERWFAWLQNWLGFVHLGCIVILMRQYF